MEWVWGPETVLIPAAAAFAAALALTPIVRAIARRTGFMDRPGADTHKEHAAPVPYGGGAAIWLAMIAAAAVIYSAGWLRTSGPKAGILPILGFGTIVFALGLVDDLRPLPPWVRLAVHTGCAVGLWAFGLRMTVFVGGTAFSLAATVAWVVVITNAMNLLDNMDGLAAGVAALAAGVLAFPALSVGPQKDTAAALLALAGGSIGFLVYNWHPARIFMGDAGSTFLGFTLAGLSITTVYFTQDQPQSHAVAVALPLMVLAAPLYDTSRVFIIRFREGRPLLRGDRRHTSHRLVDLGFSTPSAVGTIYLFTLAMGLGGLMLIVEDEWRVYFGIGQGLAIVAIVAILMAAKPKK
jgi:UDP-GlcNAc:undecaprenyl-phosphate/decaprenyl-phosphate GlcNAc-1-phosphate transferase